MSAEKETAGPIADLRDYVTTQLEIARLELVRSTANFTAQVASMLVIIVVSILAFSIVTIAAGLWLGDLFGNRAIGFLALGGVYILVLLLLVLLKEPFIQKPVRNRMIRTLLNKRSDG